MADRMRVTSVMPAEHTRCGPGSQGSWAVRGFVEPGRLVSGAVNALLANDHGTGWIVDDNFWTGLTKAAGEVLRSSKPSPARRANCCGGWSVPSPLPSKTLI